MNIGPRAWLQAVKMETFVCLCHCLDCRRAVDFGPVHLRMTYQLRESLITARTRGVTEFPRPAAVCHLFSLLIRDPKRNSRCSLSTLVWCSCSADMPTWYPSPSPAGAEFQFRLFLELRGESLQARNRGARLPAPFPRGSASGQSLADFLCRFALEGGCSQAVWLLWWEPSRPHLSCLPPRREHETGTAGRMTSQHLGLNHTILVDVPPTTTHWETPGPSGSGKTQRSLAVDALPGRSLTS